MDKIDRLFDAIEHPESYTSADIDALLQDPEVKEISDLLDKTKSSMQRITIPDVDEEWKRFKSDHSECATRSCWKLTGFINPKVAASVAIGIASLTAVAAFVGVGVHFFEAKKPDSISTEVHKEKSVALSNPDSVIKLEIGESSLPETIVFDNETFEDILTNIAEYYGYEVKFVSDDAKTLRLYYVWKQEMSVEDIIGSLNNFEQINLSVKDKTIIAK